VGWEKGCFGGNLRRKTLSVNSPKEPDEGEKRRKKKDRLAHKKATG